MAKERNLSACRRWRLLQAPADWSHGQSVDEREKSIPSFCAFGSHPGGCYTMENMTDSELLQRYAQSRCESAFTELVDRYLDFVHSAALRQVGGDTHLAQDVTQSVFVDLARKAPLLTTRTVLTGWLYTST